MNHFAANWPAYAFAALVIPFVVVYFIRRGKGLFIGGDIRETIGHANGANAVGFATLVTVHTLNSSDPTRAVALEIVTKAATEIRTTPVTVSRQEAIALAALLNEAARRLSD